MVIFLNLDGTAQKVTPARVFQGSNNVTDVTVIAPYPSTTVMDIGFILPNGMYWVGEQDNRYMPMQFVEQDAVKGVSAWTYKLPRSVTANMGDVFVAVNASSTDGNTTSYLCKITIEESVLPDLPTEPEPDVYELLHQYISRLDGLTANVPNLVASIQKVAGKSNAITYTTESGQVSAEIVLGGGEDVPVSAGAAGVVTIPERAWQAVTNEAGALIGYTTVIKAAMHGQMRDGATAKDLWVSFDEAESAVFKGAYEDYTVNEAGDITIYVNQPVDLTVRVWNGKGLVDTKAREDIAAEKERAEAAEQQLQENIEAEIERAEAAESGLQSQVKELQDQRTDYVLKADNATPVVTSDTFTVTETGELSQTEKYRDIRTGQETQTTKTVVPVTNERARLFLVQEQKNLSDLVSWRESLYGNSLNFEVDLSDIPTSDDDSAAVQAYLTEKYQAVAKTEDEPLDQTTLTDESIPLSFRYYLSSKTWYKITQGQATATNNEYDTDGQLVAQGATGAVVGSNLKYHAFVETNGEMAINGIDALDTAVENHTTDIVAIQDELPTKAAIYKIVGPNEPTNFAIGQDLSGKTLYHPDYNALPTISASTSFLHSTGGYTITIDAEKNIDIMNPGGASAWLRICITGTWLPGINSISLPADFGVVDTYSAAPWVGPPVHYWLQVMMASKIDVDCKYNYEQKVNKSGDTMTGDLNVLAQIKENGQRVYSANNPQPDKVYTIVISNQEEFDAWVNANNISYSRVLIKQGNYVASKQIRFDTSTQVYIEGVGNVTIGASDLGGAVIAAGESNVVSVKGLTINSSGSNNIMGLHRIQHVENCFVNVTLNRDLASAYGFHSCKNLYNSSARMNYTHSTASASVYAFYQCENLHNCSVQEITRTGSCAADVFYQCSNLVRCSANLTGLRNGGTTNCFNKCSDLVNCTGNLLTSFTTTPALCIFLSCSKMTNCQAELVIPVGGAGGSSVVKSCTNVSNTKAISNTSYTGVYAFNLCDYLSNCIAEVGTSYNEFYDCKHLSSCSYSPTTNVFYPPSLASNSFVDIDSCVGNFYTLTARNASSIPIYVSFASKSNFSNGSGPLPSSDYSVNVSRNSEIYFSSTNSTSTVIQFRTINIGGILIYTTSSSVRMVPISASGTQSFSVNSNYPFLFLPQFIGSSPRIEIS